MARNEWEAAYRACTYRAFLPGGVIDLRIGEPNASLAAWMQAEGVASVALMTAWNPGSQPLSAEENAERQSALECELLEGNYEPYSAEHVPDDASAPQEESCCVPDIALEDALALAGDYGQNAIVFAGPDATPLLFWCEGA